MSTGIGRPVLRKEDARLLTGAGRYVEDIVILGETRAYVVRSPHAHATIRHIDKTIAAQMPGVTAILTGDDIRADRLPPVPCLARIPLKPGTNQIFPERPVLAIGRVRFVGDPVAIVVAETINQARDAAERLIINYDPPCKTCGRTSRQSLPGLRNAWAIQRKSRLRCSNVS